MIPPLSPPQPTKQSTPRCTFQCASRNAQLTPPRCACCRTRCRCCARCARCAGSRASRRCSRAWRSSRATPRCSCLSCLRHRQRLKQQAWRKWQRRRRRHYWRDGWRRRVAARRPRPTAAPAWRCCAARCARCATRTRAYVLRRSTAPPRLPSWPHPRCQVGGGRRAQDRAWFGAHAHAATPLLLRPALVLTLASPSHHP